MQKLIFIFRLAYRNLKLNYKKNLAALISIVAGFMSINLFEGYMKGAQDIFNENYEYRFTYGDLTIHHSDAFNNSIFFDGINYISKKTQDQLIEHLQSTNRVEIFVRKLNFRGMMTNGHLTTPIIGEGIDVNESIAMRAPVWSWNTSAGHPLRDGEANVVLGEELGRLLNCQALKKEKFLNLDGGYIAKERALNCSRSQMQISSTTDSGQANAIFLNVSGVLNTLYRELDSRYVQLPLSNAQSLLDTQGISLITLKLIKGADKKDFITSFESFINENKLPLKISSWKDNAFGDLYRQSMSFLNVLRGFFLVVILLIVTFSIMATQTRLVFERIKETATLRSLGFTNGLVTQIFICEALVLTLLGVVIGSLFSVIVSFAVKKIGIFYLIGILSEQVPFTIALITNNFIYSGFVLIILVTIACYIPLRKTLSMSISEAFAHN